MSDPKIIKREIDSYLDNLLRDRNIQQRLPVPSYLLKKDTEYVKQFIASIFIKCDSDIDESNYVHLPEYDQLIKYIQNTEGLGLLLRGNSGTGKSIILKQIIPLLFQIRNTNVFPVSCYDIHEEPLYKQVRLRRYILLDEIGVEKKVAINGSFVNTFNPVERLIGISEDENKAFFATTNLDSGTLGNTYGKRSIDRIVKRCRVINFKSLSLR